jgi:hypothetical protein
VGTNGARAFLAVSRSFRARQKGVLVRFSDATYGLVAQGSARLPWLLGRSDERFSIFLPVARLYFGHTRATSTDAGDILCTLGGSVFSANHD